MCCGSGSSTTTRPRRSTARSRRSAHSRRRRRVTRPDSIQARLARPFDPAELRRIKRLWVRHSIAEDRRDIDGLIATLSPDCVYEIAVTGQRWEGHDGARAFYTELFAAFPDNAFALSEIVIGPQGVFEVATLTGTNEGPWAGAPPSGLAVALEVVILFPWDRTTGLFSGERIWFDREGIGSDRGLAGGPTIACMSGYRGRPRRARSPHSITCFAVAPCRAVGVGGDVTRRSGPASHRRNAIPDHHRCGLRPERPRRDRRPAARPGGRRPGDHDRRHRPRPLPGRPAAGALRAR